MSGHATQRRNSRKSPMRTIPGSRDQGERYVVRYRDGMGTRRVFGYTESLDVAEQWREAINRHLIWDTPTILDRKGKTT